MEEGRISRRLVEPVRMVMSKSPTSEFQSSAGGVMIRVPAGSFTMGSPESEDGHRAWEQQREVTFGSDFYLGKTPVTQDQFEAVTGTNPTGHERIGNAPVDSVSWEQANEYCQKLTKLDREAGVLPDGWEYRLPTEAEWEYACRAGSSEPRHGEPQDVAWYQDNAEGKPHAVGQKTRNPWGFHDMLGNVWEWCQD
jgi:formylglycine-generating enzyme required for sulfatase activity